MRNLEVFGPIVLDVLEVLIGQVKIPRLPNVLIGLN